MTPACEYCGAPFPISRLHVGCKSEAKPAPDQVHKIVSRGPNGTFEAVFTPDEWMDRSVAGRAARDAAARLIHRQAGHKWPLGI